MVHKTSPLDIRANSRVGVFHVDPEAVSRCVDELMCLVHDALRSAPRSYLAS